MNNAVHSVTSNTWGNKNKNNINDNINDDKYCK